MRSTRAWRITLGFTPMLLLFVPSGLAAQQADNGKQVAALLASAQRTAYNITRAASELETFRFSNLTWETHTNKLNEIKHLSNQLSQTLTALNEKRAHASPEQRQSIDRLFEALGEFASSMDMTLHHLRHNQQNIEACVRADPDYKGLLKTNYQLAARLTER